MNPQCGKATWPGTSGTIAYQRMPCQVSYKRNTANPVVPLVGPPLGAAVPHEALTLHGLAKVRKNVLRDDMICEAEAEESLEQLNGLRYEVAGWLEIAPSMRRP